MEKKTRHPAGSSFWQIIFPVAAAAALLILAGIWFAGFASPGKVSRFAEISTILLVVPTFISALIFALLPVGLIFLAARLMVWIPQATGPVLNTLQKVRDAAVKVSGLSAKVVIEPAAWLAGIRRKKRPADQEISLGESKGGKQL